MLEVGKYYIWMPNRDFDHEKPEAFLTLETDDDDGRYISARLLLTNTGLVVKGNTIRMGLTSNMGLYSREMTPEERAYVLLTGELP
jgi:hypothetical protein